MRTENKTKNREEPKCRSTKSKRRPPPRTHQPTTRTRRATSTPPARHTDTRHDSTALAAPRRRSPHSSERLETGGARTNYNNVNATAGASRAEPFPPCPPFASSTCLLPSALRRAESLSRDPPRTCQLHVPRKGGESWTASPCPPPRWAAARSRSFSCAQQVPCFH